MSPSNVELARRGFEAMRRGEVDAIGVLLDEHVRWHWAGDADSGCHNRAQALAYMRRPGRRGPGELVDVIDAGDRVVVITQPPPEDGTPVPLHAQITSFRDGKVVEMVGYDTVESALAAAGVQWPRAAPRTERSFGRQGSMYGYIGEMTTQPGHRDEVIAILIAAAEGLREAGCHQYTVGASDADEITIWVSEVWDSQEAHDVSLQQPEARAAIARAMPMIAGVRTRIQTTVAGGLGLTAP